MTYLIVPFISLLAEHPLDGVGLPVGLGGGGFAAVVFYFYRQERARNSELTTQVIEAFKTNTKAITELTDVIVAMKERTFCPMGGEEIGKFIQTINRLRTGQ